jgi:hypothetical protein
MSRKQDKWADVVREKGIDLHRALNFVTAREVKRITREEPRLMASITNEKDLPEVFRQNGVFVLPISSDTYVLVHGKGYHELEPVTGEPERFESRLPFELTMLSYGTGEQRYLLHAYHSGLLGHFGKVPEIYPAALGKMRTGDFRFRVDGSPEIDVQSAGMEIDMGFEGRKDILLFEGKARQRDNFLIRQLYYPFRVASGFSQKTVRTFFFVANPKDRTYTIWEYAWEDPLDYEQIRLRNKGRYVVVEIPPPIEDFATIEPDAALDIVPQADDFQKVAELPLLVAEGIHTAQEWARRYHISPRQGSYYREAAEALGLVAMEDGNFVLTDEGRRYVRMDVQDRSDFLVRRILRVPIMNKVFELVRRSPARGTDKNAIAEMIKRTSHLSGTTPPRRASTVLSYFRWMSKNTGIVVVRGQRIHARSSALDSFGG